VLADSVKQFGLCGCGGPTSRCAVRSQPGSRSSAFLPQCPRSRSGNDCVASAPGVGFAQTAVIDLDSNLKSHSDGDVAASVAYGKADQDLSAVTSGQSQDTKFADAQDALSDCTIRYDISFFEGLNRIIQTEPWLERNRARIDPLKTLGVEKGKPFNPPAETKAVLKEGIREAQAWLEAKYDAGLPPY
jgi:hypothetical protein